MGVAKRTCIVSQRLTLLVSTCVRAPAQGLTTVAMKLAIVKLLDYNFVAEAMFRFGSYSGDWKQFNATRRKRPHSQ